MSKPLFGKVCIVGVGLIGGSLGQAIRKKRLATRVVGVVRRPAAVADSIRRGALDEATTDLRSGVRGADLVILAAPVSTIASQMSSLKRHLVKGALVIDVASSKVLVEKAAKRHLRGACFVGCHPMAGKEKIGLSNATPGLFRDAVCFVTASEPRVNALWKAVGAKPVVLSAKAHDAWVARASHLPHILSFNLFQNLKAPKKWPVNPSLKALHRLAQSDAELWADIFVSNRAEALRAISEFQKALSKFHYSLKKSDANSLRRLITKANKNAR